MKLLHTFAMVGAPCLILIVASLESGRHTNPPVTAEHTIQQNLAVPQQSTQCCTNPATIATPLKPAGHGTRRCPESDR